MAEVGVPGHCQSWVKVEAEEEVVHRLQGWAHGHRSLLVRPELPASPAQHRHRWHSMSRLWGNAF